MSKTRRRYEESIGAGERQGWLHLTDVGLAPSKLIGSVSLHGLLTQWTGSFSPTPGSGKSGFAPLLLSGVDLSESGSVLPYCRDVEGVTFSHLATHMATFHMRAIQIPFDAYEPMIDAEISPEASEVIRQHQLGGLLASAIEAVREYVGDRRPRIVTEYGGNGSPELFVEIPAELSETPAVMEELDRFGAEFWWERRKSVNIPVVFTAG